MLSIAGAIAGFLVFLVINPGMVREETLSIPDRPGDVLMSAIMLGASFAALLSGILAAADEFTSPPKRVITKMAIAVPIGAVAGAFGGIFGQFAFSAMILTTPGLGIFVGRTIGWAVMGAGGGVGVGFAMGSWQRAKMSMLGGLIGGGAGGILFDVTSIITHGGSASRFIGFILMGAATGAAVAFVDEIAKQNWVTVLSGPKEGRSFIITKPTTTIGRDELADIPLFGDPNVTKQHAYLLMQDNNVSVQSASGVVVSVNNSPTQSATLKDGDLLGVGRFHLRFNQKAELAVKAASQPQQRWSDVQSTPQPTMQPYSAPQQTVVQPVAMGNLVLTAVGGPHMNQKFQFGPGSVKIGREAGCQILLAQDTMVSRNHAEITWNGSGWIIRDLGSTNGLWARGQRANEQALQIGDQIGIGQTILRVDSI